MCARLNNEDTEKITVVKEVLLEPKRKYEAAGRKATPAETKPEQAVRHSVSQ